LKNALGVETRRRLLRSAVRDDAMQAQRNRNKLPPLQCAAGCAGVNIAVRDFRRDIISV